MNPDTNQAPQSHQAAGDNTTLFGVLAYIGPLVIVSFLMAKDNPFVKFHIKQGAVLFAIEVVVWFVASMMWQLWMFINIVNLATIVLSIIGIVNVVQHHEKPLPVVGSLSQYFKF